MLMDRMPVGPCERIKLVAVFMPSLLNCFAEAEREARAPLTHCQAKKIRNTAIQVLVSEETASTLQQRRGFVDLDPDDFWTEWLQRRKATQPPRLSTREPNSAKFELKTR